MIGRYLTRGGSVLALTAFASLACGDRDHTDICVGPGCGVGGTAGSAGDGGEAGSPPDAGGGAGATEQDGGADTGAGDQCEVVLSAPLAGDAGELHLGPEDDADGTACGAEFSLQVAVATNASTLQFFANDAPVASADVTSVLTEAVVPLGNRGSTPNTLRVVAEMPDGSSCETTFAGDIFVDCEGPSCSISAPVPAVQSFLNATQDGDSLAPGLQTNVAVGSELEHAGQSVRLMVDDTFLPDDEALAADGSAALATFPGVSLPEGAHQVRAECRDAEGNITLSPIASWTVDLTPCTLAVDSVAGGADPITALNDVDSNTGNGLQVLVAGQISGAGCETLRLGECSGAPSAVALSGAGSFSAPVTLAHQTQSFSVCAEVVDEAGNESVQVTVDVDVRATAPAVQITSPSNGDLFNVATGCSTVVAVNCSDDGADVDLTVDGSPAGSEVCTAGSASFNVNLTSKDNGDVTTLAVAQTADGLTSAPESIDVRADCNAPVLSFDAPSCATQLALGADDVEPLSPGLQFDVVVQNGGVPDVTLTVTRGAIEDESFATGDATSTTFDAADLGDPGSIELSACATDPQGNPGCTPACAITIAAEPTLSITSPSNGATITSSTPDCDSGTAGVQVTVQGTTTASDDSIVNVTLGSAPPESATVNAGAWSACIQVDQGDSQTLTVDVTDDQTQLFGSTEITLSVDTLPGGVVGALAVDITGRRQGTLDLSWDSVLDSGGAPLAAYRLRCATTNITDEATWGTATNIPVGITPAGTAGQTETVSLTGFRTGTSRFCMVRGEDDSGNLSPVGTSTSVSNPFLTKEYSVVDDPNTAGFVLRISVDPLGDINGDGIADFIHGATNGVAQVYFGQDPIPEAGVGTPDFQITFGGSATNAIGFGSEVAGLGDINGDTIPDFAVGAPGATAVFVFFGRSNTDPVWTDIDVDTSSADGCEADLCIIGTGLGLFGWDVHSANFDGSGPNDLVIAARTAATNGQVFILMGGTQLATPGTTITVQTSTATPNPDGFIVNGTSDVRNFGFSVGSIGTGLNDILIGANGFGGTAGAVYFLAAQSTPAAGSGLTTLTSQVEVDTGAIANFGNAVRGIGDYNGDGFVDFAAGESFANPPGGIATLYLGDASGTFSSTNATLSFTNDFSPVVDDNYGQFIAMGLRPDLGLVGDLDDDGFAELVVGATIPDTPAGSRGSAQLFYGGAGATGRGRVSADMSYTSELTSGQVVPNFVGDINDDGFNDLAMLSAGISAGDLANKLFLLY